MTHDGSSSRAPRRRTRGAAGTGTSTGATRQRWQLRVGGRTHRVEIEGRTRRTVSWYRDDELTASKTSTEDRLRLQAEPATEESVALVFDTFGRATRVTLVPGRGGRASGVRAARPAAGVDLDPEPGSWAARRAQRIREHPRRYAVIAAATGVARVVVPLLLGVLAVRFAVDLPWPDWDIPWPELDLPSVPWPRIPWPELELPRWQAPPWVGWVVERAKYVVPVLLALLLARREIVRQRRQDALKTTMTSESAPAARTDPDDPAEQEPPGEEQR